VRRCHFVEWLNSGEISFDVDDVDFPEFSPRTSTPSQPSKSSRGNDTRWNTSPFDAEVSFPSLNRSRRRAEFTVHKESESPLQVEPRSLPDQVAPPCALDSLGRLIDLGRDSLRRPDVSIVHQSVHAPYHNQEISHGPVYEIDKTICMAENKLMDKKAAVRQLQRIMAIRVLLSCGCLLLLWGPKALKWPCSILQMILTYWCQSLTRTPIMVQFGIRHATRLSMKVWFDSHLMFKLMRVGISSGHMKADRS
jgi:hypothetical protein